MSISAKIGNSPQTLNGWDKKAEIDSVTRSSEVAEWMKALEREDPEQSQANKIPCKNNAHFAMSGLDRRSK